jgi:hypothetical protein
MGLTVVAGSRTYGDYIDQLDDQVSADQVSIAAIKKDMSRFRATVGEVTVLKKEMVEVKREVRNLRTTVDTFVKLVQSDADPAALSAYANQVAIDTRHGSVAPSAMSGSEVDSKKTRKKRAKAPKTPDPDVPEYTEAQRRIVVVSLDLTY